MFKVLTEVLPKVLNCENVQIYLFLPIGIDKYPSELLTQKTLFQSKYITGIFRADCPVVDPCFHHMYEIEVPMRHPHFMSMPLFTREAALHSVVQVLSKKNSHGQNVHFTIAEEQLL